MFGALMQAGNLGLPREAYGDAFKVTFAKKPWLNPLEPGDSGGGGRGGQGAGDGGEEVKRDLI